MTAWLAKVFNVRFRSACYRFVRLFAMGALAAYLAHTPITAVLLVGIGETTFRLVWPSIDWTSPLVGGEKITATLVAATLTLFAAGCKKKAPTPPPAPPPPAPVSNEAPTPPRPPAPVVAQFSAEPTSIQRGQSSTLRWDVTGSVTSVSVDQTIGTVQNTGNRRVFPSESTTYTLTAAGKKKLAQEIVQWGRLSAAISLVIAEA